MGRGGEVSALRVDAAAKALDRATADGPFDDIAALNAIVTVKTGEAARAAAASGKPLAPEFSAVLERGQTVYFHRVKLMVGVYSSIAAWMISVGLRELGALPVLLMAGIMFVFYDYYSGVLHIVLDHPNHINLPIIGQGCLEFQWHHHIPDDIVSKSFLEVRTFCTLFVQARLFCVCTCDCAACVRACVCASQQARESHRRSCGTDSGSCLRGVVDAERVGNEAAAVRGVRPRSPRSLSALVSPPPVRPSIVALWHCGVSREP